MLPSRTGGTATGIVIDFIRIDKRVGARGRRKRRRTSLVGQLFRLLLSAHRLGNYLNCSTNSRALYSRRLISGSLSALRAFSMARIEAMEWTVVQATQKR